MSTYREIWEKQGAQILISGDSLSYNRYSYDPDARGEACQCGAGMGSWSFALRDRLMTLDPAFVYGDEIEFTDMDGNRFSYLVADMEILQPHQTEDLVGPYALHDFFLYYILRYGFEPEKIYFLAKKAFNEDFDGETILKWLRTFYRRFFTQQFKRSCMPDGVKIGSVGISPSTDLMMPSDACANIWLKKLENIK